MQIFVDFTFQNFWRRPGCKETGWPHGSLLHWTVWKTKEKHICLQAMQLCISVGVSSRIHSWRVLFSKCLKDSWSSACFPDPSSLSYTFSFLASRLPMAPSFSCFSTYLFFLLFCLVILFKSWLRCSFPSFFSVSAALWFPIKLWGAERLYGNSSELFRPRFRTSPTTY